MGVECYSTPINHEGGEELGIKRLLSLIDTSSEWVGKVACFMVVIIMVSMTIEVVSRYGFNQPTVWVWDVSEQLGAAFYMLGGAYVLLHHGHVRVDVLYTRFPLKVKAITDLVTSILFFFFCIVLIWKGGELAWGSTMIREVENSLLAPPLYPLRWLFVIASLLLLLQGGAKFIRDLGIVITGKEIAR